MKVKNTHILVAASVILILATHFALYVVINKRIQDGEARVYETLHRTNLEVEKLKQQQLR